MFMYNLAAHACKFLLKRRGKLYIRNKESLPTDTGFASPNSFYGKKGAF